MRSPRLRISLVDFEEFLLCERLVARELLGNLPDEAPLREQVAHRRLVFDVDVQALLRAEDRDREEHPGRAGEHIVVNGTAADELIDRPAIISLADNVRVAGAQIATTAGHEAQPRGSRVALALPRALHPRVHLEGKLPPTHAKEAPVFSRHRLREPVQVRRREPHGVCSNRRRAVILHDGNLAESLDHRVGDGGAVAQRSALVVIQTDAVRLIARVVYFPVHEQRLVRDLLGDAQIRAVEADDVNLIGEEERGEVGYVPVGLVSDSRTDERLGALPRGAEFYGHLVEIVLDHAHRGHVGFAEAGEVTDGDDGGVRGFALGALLELDFFGGELAGPAGVADGAQARERGAANEREHTDDGAPHDGEGDERGGDASAARERLAGRVG